MSKKNGKNQIHRDVLMPSTIDEVSLCQKVQDGFLTICATYKNQNDMELCVPKSLDMDMLRWRTMVIRYKKKDMRHTEAEFKSLKVIAQWTIDVNCKLRGQSPKKVNWK